MTTQTYGPAAPSRPRAGPPVTLAGVAWRAVVSVLAVVAGTIGAIAAGYAAASVWSGCLFACTGGNHPLGAGLAALSVALLAAGPLCTARLFGVRGWWPVVAGTAALTLLAGVPVLAG